METYTDPEKYANSLSIEKLVKLLTKFSDSYYNSGKSLVSDNVYDTMFDVLKERDPQNKYFKNIMSLTILIYI